MTKFFKQLQWVLLFNCELCNLLVNEFVLYQAKYYACVPNQKPHINI